MTVDPIEELMRRTNLAASRAVFVAVTQPERRLGDAGRMFNYRPRTMEGDAFETAFEWAREEVRLTGWKARP